MQSTSTQPCTSCCARIHFQMFDSLSSRWVTYLLTAETTILPRCHGWEKAERGNEGFKFYYPVLIRATVPVAPGIFSFYTILICNVSMKTLWTMTNTSWYAYAPQMIIAFNDTCLTTVTSERTIEDNFLSNRTYNIPKADALAIELQALLVRYVACGTKCSASCTVNSAQWFNLVCNVQRHSNFHKQINVTLKIDQRFTIHEYPCLSKIRRNQINTHSANEIKGLSLGVRHA